MRILNDKLFKKYRGHPLRYMFMFPDNIGIAEGCPVIAFKTNERDSLKVIFPTGIYKTLK